MTTPRSSSLLFAIALLAVAGNATLGMFVYRYTVAARADRAQISALQLQNDTCVVDGKRARTIHAVELLLLSEPVIKLAHYEDNEVLQRHLESARAKADLLAVVFIHDGGGTVKAGEVDAALLAAARATLGPLEGELVRVAVHQAGNHRWLVAGHVFYYYGRNEGEFIALRALD